MGKGIWENLWVANLCSHSYKNSIFIWLDKKRYYEGHMPVLVTSDLELIEEIAFKQFTNFTGRRVKRIYCILGLKVYIYMKNKNHLFLSLSRCKLRTVMSEQMCSLRQETDGNVCEQ